MSAKRKRADTWSDEKRAMRRALAILPDLYDLEQEISDVDDVAQGFQEPKDVARLAAARAMLADALPGITKEVEHTLAMTSTIGPDPEADLIYVLSMLTKVSACLAETLPRCRSKLGRMPPRTRVLQGERIWKNRRGATSQAAGGPSW